jgi:hypothetical protein
MLVVTSRILDCATEGATEARALRPEFPEGEAGSRAWLAVVVPR